MKNKLGYRGYIFSKEIRGNFIPQRVQNLVIKDYAQRNKIFFKLSATEYNFQNHKNLKQVLKRIKSIDGMIFYSLFMLPFIKKDRLEIYNKFLDNKKHLHFALEEIVIKSRKDSFVIEDILSIKKNTLSI
tara:strand:- start:128 stop:517 length:390 start_codon:yes stop_codon:yes gene_type:complete